MESPCCEVQLCCDTSNVRAIALYTRNDSRHSLIERDSFLITLVAARFIEDSNNQQHFTLVLYTNSMMGDLFTLYQITFWVLWSDNLVLSALLKFALNIVTNCNSNLLPVYIYNIHLFIT